MDYIVDGACGISLASSAQRVCKYKQFRQFQFFFSSRAIEMRFEIEQGETLSAQIQKRST